MPTNHEQLIDALKEISHRDKVAEVSRYFWPDPNAHSSDNKILGVSIGKIFPVAKQFVEMSVKDVERLLDNPYYEVRVGAVSIMDFQRSAQNSSDEPLPRLLTTYST
jgi:hypothetical protein